MYFMNQRRRTSARGVEDMQRTITELETKLKSESSRLKKKYESEQQDLIIQIDNLNRTNADLAKANKSLATKLKVNFDRFNHIIFLCGELKTKVEKNSE